MSLTPNMNLQVPSVGSTTGTTYAQQINNSLTIVDGHDHSPGYGVPITPAGLNVNSDLPLQNNNLVTIRTMRMTSQSAVLTLPTDLDCLYTVSGDLYYNDGAGNNVRITQSGGVAGSPGSIANLTSPASASYVAANSTFVWQSAANTPANLDAASVIFRNLTASSKGLTVSPPNAMAADYAITLPTLPASQKFMTIDAAGNMSAPWAVDNSTLEIASSTTLRVKDLGISTAKIADLAVTTAKLAAGAVTTAKIADGAVDTTELASNAVTTVKITDAAVTQAKLYTRSTNAAATAGNVLVTAGSGSYFNNTTSQTLVVTGSLVCTGRPVRIDIISQGLSVNINTDGSTGAIFICRDGTPSTGVTLASIAVIGSGALMSGIIVLDTPAAGTHVYGLYASGPGGGLGIGITNVALMAYEL